MEINMSDRQKRGLLSPYQRWVSDRIPDALDEWSFCTGRVNAEYKDFARSIRARRMPGHRKLSAKAEMAPKGEPVLASINHNRWVAMCECMGQETVTWKHPVFFCWSCNNFHNNDGYPRPILFPPPDERKKIEDILVLRPDPITRNWRPNETIEDLIAENINHGLSLPDWYRPGKEK